MKLIYHLTTDEEFFSQIESEYYSAPTLTSEGFIHFSQAHQVKSVAERFYMGVKGLILLVVDQDKLTATLKYEPPFHPVGEVVKEVEAGLEDLFPHLYGKLNKTSIVNILTMRQDENGKYIQTW